MKSDPNVIFEDSIPGNYDCYLGPAFFEPFAKDITARLSGERPAKVLEIACGTGILTRLLRDSLAPAVQLVATDLNPGMFAFAQDKFSANQNIKWQQADVVALPFPDSSFAVSQKIAEHCGLAPVESTMQAFVWRAVHQ